MIDVWGSIKCQLLLKNTAEWRAVESGGDAHNDELNTD